MVTRGSLIDTKALGAAFSSHVWSTVWDAIAWPRSRLILGVMRWIVAGKNPSILEKWWAARVGVRLYCLLVRDAISIASARPRTETARAASFRPRGMVRTGTLEAARLEVIRRPARTLPKASRLIGLITAGLFSLMGERGLKRGWPIDTRKMIRRL